MHPYTHMGAHLCTLGKHTLSHKQTLRRVTKRCKIDLAKIIAQWIMFFAINNTESDRIRFTLIGL